MASMVKHVYLAREEWGADKGKLTGSITMISASSEVKVRLNNDQAIRIMAILADELVACAQETAELMRADFLEAIPTLAAPAEESEL